MKNLKTLTIIIATILCVSLIFAGCGKEEAKKTEGAQKTASPAATTSSPSPSKSPTPTPVPTPTPKLEEAFSADFSGDMTGWDAYVGDWSVKDGKLVVNPEDRGPKVVAKDTNFKNFVMEADMSIDAIREGQSVHNAGFIFHVSNPSEGADAYNGYYVGISLTDAIAGRANGGWTELMKYDLDEPLDLGDVVKIKVEVKDGVFNFYVNDTLVLEEITDPDESFDEGSIGVRTWQCGATFDNIKVYVEAAE